MPLGMRVAGTWQGGQAVAREEACLAVLMGAGPRGFVRGVLVEKVEVKNGLVPALHVRISSLGPC